jgi:hypothetical protein
MSQEQNHKSNLEMARRKKLQSEAGSLKSAGKSLTKAAEGPAWMAPIRAMKLALEMRKKAKEGMDAPWVLAISLAIACDLADLLPIAGWIISWIFRPFLFIFLFKTGRWKVKLLRALLMLFDAIPFVNMLPWTTIAVIHAYKGAHKKLKEADKKIEEVQQIQQQAPAYADGYDEAPMQKAA